jgi:hypothetical protein
VKHGTKFLDCVGERVDRAAKAMPFVKVLELSGMAKVGFRD